jgi:hypothetical protein
MAGRGLGTRAVLPVLGDDLLGVGQIRAVLQLLVDLLAVLAAGLAADHAHRRAVVGAELGGRGERKGGHVAPVRSQEPLHGAVGQPQRLPVVGVNEGVGGVDRLIAGRHELSR